MSDLVLNFSDVEAPQKVTADWVLDRVSTESIFYNYHGPFIPKKAYSSVFRKDSSPSAAFFYSNKTGKLKYGDRGTGESWDCFAFVSQMFGITYGEAIKKVACDFGLTKCEGEPMAKKILEANIQFDKKLKEATVIQIVPGKWTKEMLDFWRQYEITRTELDFWSVYPVEHLFINKQYISNRNDRMRFAYLIRHKGKEYIKVYIPYADREKELKWITNATLEPVWGMEQLDYTKNTVIVTKSLKDLMVLKKIYPNCVSTQNESEAALTDGLISHLKAHFSRIILWWDGDMDGKEKASKMCLKWGIESICVPEDEFGTKDPSDFVKRYGLKALKQFFHEQKLL